MKHLGLLLYFSIATIVAAAQKSSTTDSALTKKDTFLIVDAACGQCMFQMKGKDCDLAVRVNGKTYYVDGTHIDEHGDAHAEDGFCNAIKKAKVQGTVVDDRFKATSFQLVPEKEKKKKKS